MPAPLLVALLAGVADDVEAAEEADALLAATDEPAAEGDEAALLLAAATSLGSMSGFEPTADMSMVPSSFKISGLDAKNARV